MAQQEAFDFPEEPVASHRASEPSRTEACTRDAGEHQHLPVLRPTGTSVDHRQNATGR